MMVLFKYIIDFFLSLRTTLWLLGASLVLMFAGAFIMPGRREFQALHSIPLFEWMQSQSLQLTWWLWILIGILVILTINTLFCSVESIVKKRAVTQWLLLISPQIIHIGFLFVLLAHLLSAFGASQEEALAKEGSVLKIRGSDRVLRIDDINITLDYFGRITDWQVKVDYQSKGRSIHRDIIGPNDPSTYMSLNVNVKNLSANPRAVLLQINREPGAIWALSGSILFIIGTVTLVMLKIRMEK